MAWYSDGTLSIAAGATAVAGTGVAWQTAGIKPGDALLIAGRDPAEIASVESETGLTLASPWPGAAVTNTDYTILPVSPRHTTTGALTDRVSALLDAIEGTLSPDRLAVNGTIAAADTATRLLSVGDRHTFRHAGDDVAVVVDKAATGDTGTAEFKTNGVTKARLGLIGTDDVALEVVHSGSAFKTALSVDRYTGRVTFPNNGAREVLTAARTYYVSPSGLNSNDGLTVGTAFGTIQYALDRVANQLDLGGFTVTIQVQPGTYSETLTVGGPWVGKGGVRLVGDTVTPSSVILSSSGNVISVLNGGLLEVSGIKVNATGNAAWRAQDGGVLVSGGANELGSLGAHGFFAKNYGRIIIDNRSTVISGGATGYLFNSSVVGYIDIGRSSFIFTGDPQFGGIAIAWTGGIIRAYSNTFTGSVSGKRYLAKDGALIHTSSGGPDYFPGTVAGSISNGGVYG